MNRTRWYIFFAIIFLVAGFLRESFFININVILYHHWYKTPYVRPLPAIVKPLESLSYETLYWLKYAFTAASIVLYYLLNRWTLTKISGQKMLIRVLNWSFILMLSLSLFSQLYGYLVNHRLADDEYTLSRWLAGIAQSPIICLILLASEKLYQKTHP